MPDDVRSLLATAAAIDKLGARRIDSRDTAQVLEGRHAVVPNARGDERTRDERRLLIGRDAGGRWLTLVVEATLDPTTWLIVTGRESTQGERRLGPR